MKQTKTIYKSIWELLNKRHFWTNIIRLYLAEKDPLVGGVKGILNSYKLFL